MGPVTDERAERIKQLRREPPPLQPVTVTDRQELSPRLLRFTFEGLEELAVEGPAASVRLLVPPPGSDELVIPTWNGNEFLLPDGSRPALRTFTPLRVDEAAGRVDLEIVRHEGGVISGWAEGAQPGAVAAISGPGAAYEVDPSATRFVLFGDETALPAISDLLVALPTETDVEVHIEVITPDAEIPLAAHPRTDTTWHVRKDGDRPGAALVETAQAIESVDPGTRIWAAGEAASMQAIRNHLFKTLKIPRSQASIRGYWKPAR